MSFTREQTLARLRQRIDAGEPIIGGGAGTGITAKFARAQRADVIVLCHGGPIAMPEDAQYVLSRTNGVNGFYGASSMERLPVESALVEQVRRFKAIRFK